MRDALECYRNQVVYDAYHKVVHCLSNDLMCEGKVHLNTKLQDDVISDQLGVGI